MTSPPSTNIYEFLPTALKRLYGKVILPPDNGKALIEYLQSSNNPLVGPSDASLKHGQCCHAWILLTGQPQHIDDPTMSFKGSGAVDGAPEDQSSTRGELQGQTALAIIANNLLEHQQALNIPVTLITDNQGVQTKCGNLTTNCLHNHHDANMDLWLEYQNATKSIKTTNEWARSHQAKDNKWETIQDLEKLNIPNNAIMNIHCDQEAKLARKSNYSDTCAYIYPSKKWALFISEKSHQKIVENWATVFCNSCIMRDS
jgi:hypothetical protein